MRKQITERKSARNGFRQKTNRKLSAPNVLQHILSFLSVEPPLEIDEMKKYLLDTDVASALQSTADILSSDGHNVDVSMDSGRDKQRFVYVQLGIEAPVGAAFVRTSSYDLRFQCNWNEPNVLTAQIIKQFPVDFDIRIEDLIISHCESWADVKTINEVIKYGCPIVGRTYDDQFILYQLQLESQSITADIMSNLASMLVSLMKRSEQFDMLFMMAMSESDCVPGERLTLSQLTSDIR